MRVTAPAGIARQLSSPFVIQGTEPLDPCGAHQPLALVDLPPSHRLRACSSDARPGLRPSARSPQCWRAPSAPEPSSPRARRSFFASAESTAGGSPTTPAGARPSSPRDRATAPALPGPAEALFEHGRNHPCSSTVSCSNRRRKRSSSSASASFIGQYHLDRVPAQLLEGRSPLVADDHQVPVRLLGGHHHDRRLLARLGQRGKEPPLTLGAP